MQSKIIYISGKLYKSEQQLAKEWDVSIRTVRTRVAEIKAEIKNGRYGEYAISEDGPKIVLVHYPTWVDYMTHRQKLKQKNLRKTVKPFDACKVAREIGLYDVV